MGGRGWTRNSALLRAGLLGGLPTHGTWRYPRMSHVPVDKMRGCVPATGVRFTGGSGGRPRAMRWALVSTREAPTAAKAAKMVSTSVNCMVREADGHKVLGWVGRPGSKGTLAKPFIQQPRSKTRSQPAFWDHWVNDEKVSSACPCERDLCRNKVSECTPGTRSIRRFGSRWKLGGPTMPSGSRPT